MLCGGNKENCHDDCLSSGNGLTSSRRIVLDGRIFAVRCLRRVQWRCSGSQNNRIIAIVIQGYFLARSKVVRVSDWSDTVIVKLRSSREIKLYFLVGFKHSKRNRMGDFVLLVFENNLVDGGNWLILIVSLSTPTQKTSLCVPTSPAITYKSVELKTQ